MENISLLISIALVGIVLPIFSIYCMFDFIITFIKKIQKEKPDYKEKPWMLYSYGKTIEESLANRERERQERTQREEQERPERERQEKLRQEKEQREQGRRERERQERARRIEEELEWQRQQREREQREHQQRQQQEHHNHTDIAYIQANWHQILGVTFNAVPQDIKRAYKKKMSEYHPDKVSQLGEKLRELAKIESQRINAAYKYAQSQGLV